jgi:hypothetical protein
MSQSPQPQTYNGNFADPPKALARLCLMPNWVLWKWQLNEKGDWTKPPYKASNPKQHAKSNNPETWSDRHTAVNAVLAGKADGIGFALTDTEIGAVDLDHCRDPKTGAYDEWVQRILDAAPNAYKETTVSGTGLRIIGIATGPEVHRAFNFEDGARIEIFRRATRYITVSGLELGHCVELPNIDRLIDMLVAHFDGGTQKTDGQQAEFGNGGDDIDDLIKHGAPEGQRSEAFARCVWSLAGQGLSQKEIEQELNRHPDGIASKYGKRLSGEIKRCYEKWQRENNSGASSSSHSWGDPDISILDDRRGELPAFPLDVFTNEMQALIERNARGAGVTHAHVAVPLIGIVSGLIGISCRVKVSSSWYSPLTCWTILVGISGTGKTPGINVSRRAVKLIERLGQPEENKRRRDHETRKAAAKAVCDKWKEAVEDAIQNNKTPPDMPQAAVDPGKYVAARMFVADSTIERLAELLHARSQGLILVRDELAALFMNMSRYSGGQDNEFWLEAWNGDHFNVERKNSGSLSIDHLLIGMVGGMQPDKLVASFKGDQDGQYARVLFAWPEEPQWNGINNDAAEVDEEILNILMRADDLAEFEDDRLVPYSLPLDEEAAETFAAFAHFAHQERKALEGRERDWTAKMTAHVLRLAGTLTYMEWGLTTNPRPVSINLRTMQAAITFVRDYFWPHARACLRQIGLTERHANARRVLRWIKATHKQELSREEVRREGLGRTLDADQTQAVINNLCDAGWLRLGTTMTPGRARHRWEVNPCLFGA